MSEPELDPAGWLLDRFDRATEGIKFQCEVRTCDLPPTRLDDAKANTEIESLWHNDDTRSFVELLDRAGPPRRRPVLLHRTNEEGVRCEPTADV